METATWVLPNTVVGEFSREICVEVGMCVQTAHRLRGLQGGGP